MSIRENKLEKCWCEITSNGSNKLETFLEQLAKCTLLKPDLFQMTHWESHYKFLKATFSTLNLETSLWRHRWEIPIGNSSWLLRRMGLCKIRLKKTWKLTRSSRQPKSLFLRKEGQSITRLASFSTGRFQGISPKLLRSKLDNLWITQFWVRTQASSFLHLAWTIRRWRL